MKRIYAAIGLVWLVFALLCSLAWGTDATFQVAATADDGYTFGSGISNNAAYCRMGEKSDGTLYNTWHRWTSVNIPAGSTITAAKIQFKAAYSGSGTTVNLNIYFNDADNAANPGDITAYNAKAVTAAVAWNSVSSWTAGTWYDSPELKTILQTVINRAGWASGNAIMALVKSNDSTHNAYRDGVEYANDSSGGAKLVVSYTEPVTFIPKITIH